jgi:hypothetical protein
MTRTLTMDEIRGMYTELEICGMVNRWLEHKDTQAEYHKKYNDRKRRESKALAADPRVQAIMKEMGL